MVLPGDSESIPVPGVSGLDTTGSSVSTTGSLSGSDLPLTTLDDFCLRLEILQTARAANNGCLDLPGKHYFGRRQSGVSGFLVSHEKQHVWQVNIPHNIMRLINE